MKINESIAKNGNSISFEFFPPKTLEGFEKLFTTISELETLDPTFVSVTCGAGGGSARNTRSVIARILTQTSLVPMPHLTCIGQSDEELTRILLDYQRMGVKNILALRGDLPEGKRPTGREKSCHGVDLVRLARSFKTFSIGVAVYPEGHLESPSPEFDMACTKEKIDAGADFAITQMFFNNHYFYNFMERAGKAGIRIPIIPGIMPVTDTMRIRRFAGTCSVILPYRLIERLEKAASFEEEKKIGVDYATRQCEDLWDNGVRCFHFYTLNHNEVVTEILRNLNRGEKLLSPLKVRTAAV